MSDRKLAKVFVSKVSKLEHSRNPKDRKIARRAERKLRMLNKSIPKRMRS